MTTSEVARVTLCPMRPRIPPTAWRSSPCQLVWHSSSNLLQPLAWAPTLFPACADSPNCGSENRQGGGAGRLCKAFKINRHSNPEFGDSQAHHRISLVWAVVVNMGHPPATLHHDAPNPDATGQFASSMPPNETTVESPPCSRRHLAANSASSQHRLDGNFQAAR